jgi:hypothetical protein
MLMSHNFNFTHQDSFEVVFPPLQIVHLFSIFRLKYTIMHLDIVYV